METDMCVIINGNDQGLSLDHSIHLKLWQKYSSSLTGTRTHDAQVKK